MFFGFLTIALCVQGCGGSSGGTGPTPPASGTGSLVVSIAGLPSDVAPSVAITGPAGYSQTITATQTLGTLTPGSYVVTAARVADRGIGYAAVPVTVTVSGGSTVSATAEYGLRILPRSTAERTNTSSLPQVKLVYALPSDGTDRGFDTTGTIHRTISSGQRWLSSQTGGRYIRYDAFDGGLDIVLARLPRTDAAYFGYGLFIRDSIEKDLRAAGWNQSNVLLLVYYDGRQADRCGGSAWPPVLPGNVTALYLKGLPTAPLPCGNNPFAATPTSTPTYWEFAAVHEMFHILGIVSTAAPNHALSGHVGNDPTDLMYAGSLPWRPATVDLTKTNYYNATGLPAGLTNFATSPYVVVP